MRFHSTAGEGLVSLDDYVARMKPGQEAIYSITGDELETLRKSPQLEGFRAKGVEVMLLTDPVDEFWLPALGEYQKHAFHSVTRGARRSRQDRGAGPEADADKEDEPKADVASLIALFKLTLGDAVKDVRASERLTDSAVCLVADEERHGPASGAAVAPASPAPSARHAKRILEINPKHALIARLAVLAGKEGAADELEDFAWLLFDQARLLEGESLPDPAAFALRLSARWRAG